MSMQCRDPILPGPKLLHLQGPLGMKGFLMCVNLAPMSIHWGMFSQVVLAQYNHHCTTALLHQARTVSPPASAAPPPDAANATMGRRPAAALARHFNRGSAAGPPAMEIAELHEPDERGPPSKRRRDPAQGSGASIVPHRPLMQVPAGRGGAQASLTLWPPEAAPQSVAPAAAAAAAALCSGSLPDAGKAKPPGDSAQARLPRPSPQRQLGGLGSCTDYA